MMSLGALLNAQSVSALFDQADADNSGRKDFTPSMDRQRAEQAVSAILWAYGCRQGETSAAYACMALYKALGIDLEASKLVFVKEPTP